MGFMEFICGISVIIGTKLKIKKNKKQKKIKTKQNKTKQNNNK